MAISRRTFLGGSARAVVAGSGLLANLDAASTKEKTMTALHQIRHLDCTILFARDMAAMRDFYGNVMEFELQRELTPQWIE